MREPLPVAALVLSAEIEDDIAVRGYGFRIGTRFLQEDHDDRGARSSSPANATLETATARDATAMAAARHPLASRPVWLSRLAGRRRPGLPGWYTAFVRRTTQRNIDRIPLP